MLYLGYMLNRALPTTTIPFIFVPSGESTHIHVPQAVWMVTWVAVVTLNVDLGLAVGVVVSMMAVVCRTQR